MNPVIPLLRAARCLLGWSQSDVSSKFDIKAKTIQLIERGRYKFLPREALILKSHYQAAGVEFTEISEQHGAGVRWRLPGTLLEDGTLDHFGSRVVRAARGLTDLTQRQLAKAADVDPSFIARLESNKFGAVNEATLRKLEAGLRSLNVEMTPETSSVGAGVRWIVDAAKLDTDKT